MNFIKAEAALRGAPGDAHAFILRELKLQWSKAVVMYHIIAS
jgi:hypothetical protein